MSTDGLIFDNPMNDSSFLSGSSGGTDWGSWAGAIGSGLGAIFDFQSGRQAAGDMADAYNQVAQRAEQDTYTSSSMADPFQQYRGASADRLMGILTGTQDFTTDPGYQFRMDESMRETERAAAARGMNRSGNVMAALNTRAQDVASSEYNNIVNRLIGLSGATPQNAIAGGQTYGNLMGNVYGAQISGAANQSASGGSSGLGGLFGGLGSAIGGLF